ncbi:single-stranded DNA-binding protein WHY2, mitochondrial isoform X2 [Mangifera indica]|uniref:single-stranded DNA-binding protein WHY2, mitochondrial isoform X2 n=1 Tax=Mangifera indica TaxID=29780 RepID=UPI001CF9F23A|nr:single-stranded DNA-binding protein WHY2, mitochondrial isoform X2 [Mangifera indica]
MMNLSRSMLRSRNLASDKWFAVKADDVRDAIWSQSYSSLAGLSTARHNFDAKGRVYAPYAIYKGKAAFSVDPILPTFSKLDSGDLRVQRKGVILLTFWPASGERKYDWAKRQCFGLSPTEVGSLISMGPKDSSEFFHDPSMLSSNAGQVRKTLSVKAHADGSGYFVSLNVVNNLLKTTERFTVPVTTAEFTVMKTACSFALPHLMGWDRLTNQLPVASNRSSSKVNTESLELEWDR